MSSIRQKLGGGSGLPAWSFGTKAPNGDGVCHGTGVNNGEGFGISPGLGNLDGDGESHYAPCPWNIVRPGIRFLLQLDTSFDCILINALIRAHP